MMVAPIQTAVKVARNSHPGYSLKEASIRFAGRWDVGFESEREVMGV